MRASYRVVGHRGFPEKYPENSLIGLVAAAEAGAHAVELDVQVSKDGRLMVFHDAALDRVCDVSGYIWDYSRSQLADVSCHEPTRFGDTYLPTPIVSLREICQALSSANLMVFIEAKSESFAHITRRDFLEQLSMDTQSLSNYSLISFDYEILEMAKGRMNVGWVLQNLDSETRSRAHRLSSDFLISDVDKLKDKDDIWPGSWDWFLYDIVDPEIAQFWCDNGVRYIETWNIEALLCK